MKQAAGRDLHAGRLLRRRKQGDRDEIRAEVHLLDPARRARVADLRRRAQAARARRSLARQGGGRIGGARNRRHAEDRRRRGEVRAVQAGRADPARPGLVRRRLDRPGDAAGRPGADPQARRSFDQISVAADEGVSEPALKRRIERVLPLSARVETAKENADRSSEEIRENLGFLQTILLVFGYVAVLVGAFIIFNTFSITVAQRVSEFGVLRTLGASRRQILGSVLLEAAAIGLIGGDRRAGRRLRRRRSGCGALFKAIGADLPTTGLVLEARTVIVSFAGRLRRHLRSRRWCRRCARPGCRRSPRCTASRRRSAGAGASSSSSLAGLLAAIGVAFVVAGLAGGGGISGRGGADRRRRPRRGRSPSRSSARRLVRPLADVAGWPLRAGARPHRPPRPRELEAQPGPHRGHRGGADDLARPGHLRHRLRLRAEELGRPGDRRKLRRRPGDREHRRLLADPGGRRASRPRRCRA